MAGRNLRLQISDFGFRFPNFGDRVSGSGFRVSGFGFRVQNSELRVEGLELDLRNHLGGARDHAVDSPLRWRVRVRFTFISCIC